MSDTEPTAEIPEPEPDTADVDEPEQPEQPEQPADDEPDGTAAPLEGDLPDEPIEPDEPEQPPLPPESEAEIERKVKALERAAKSYGAKVVDVMGDDLDGWQYCPFCIDHFPGIVPPVEPTEQVKARVRAAIGLPALENYRPAANARRCDECDGLGQVLSGSAVVGKQVIRCVRCAGDGFVRIGGLSTEQAAASGDPGGEVVFMDEHEAKPATDPWGRSVDDPLYGVMPGFERSA